MYALISSELVYGDAIINSRQTRVATLTGPADRENVFVRRGNTPELHLTKCLYAECTEPSLSPAGDWFVYVRKPDLP